MKRTTWNLAASALSVFAVFAVFATLLAIFVARPAVAREASPMTTDVAGGEVTDAASLVSLLGDKATASEDGAVVTLTDDIVLTSSALDFKLGEGALTLDLAGKNLTASSGRSAIVVSSGSLTLKGAGTVSSANASAGAPGTPVPATIVLGMEEPGREEHAPTLTLDGPSVTAPANGNAILVPGVMYEDESVSALALKAGNVSATSGRSAICLGQGARAGSAYGMDGYGELTLDGGTITGGGTAGARTGVATATGECSAAISLYGEAAITMNAGTVGVPAAQAAGYGLALSGGADIALLKGGSVFGPSAGIATFGGADGVIEITMTGGSVAGGTAGAGMCLTSAEGASVASQCTISGGSVTGGAGIVSLGTTLAISNGGITATSSAPVNVGDATAEGSSAEIAYVPAAVVVSAQRGYAQPSASAGSCAITGGTFVAAEGIPAIAYQSGQYQAALPSAPAASGTIDVSTGHFSSTLETSYLNSKIEVVAEAASGEAPYTYWPTSAAADAGAPGAPSTLVHPLPVNVNGLGSVSQRIAVAADGVKTYSLIAVTEPYGSTFRGWQNQYGTIVSTQSPYSVVLAEGETAPVYTAVFEGGSVAAPEDSVTVFRIYNPYNGQHLLTTDQAEVRANVNRGWEEEGTAFYAPVEGPVDVYRLYNPYNYDHYYTTKKAEVESLTALGWIADNGGEALFFGESASATPVYQLFNPYETTGTHHWTADPHEYAVLPTLGWRQEDVAFYATLRAS